jgi:hypothetical protein
MSESWIQTLTLLVSFGTGFGFLIHKFDKVDERLNAIEQRITVIETLFMAMGFPLKKTGSEDKKS